METSSERDINLGLGFATLADSFQSGREAAQMAKRELNSPERVNLVVAFGPSSIQFSKYMEGVRLVSGSDDMIGVPTPKIVMNAILPPESGLVAALQTKNTQVSIASAPIHETDIFPAITSVLTQFRQARGNIKHQFEHHGIIAFTNVSKADPFYIFDNLTLDAGLDSWLVGVSLDTTPAVPLVCRDETIPSGLIAIECLSNTPWGLSCVDMASFPKETKTHREASKTALREAIHQLQREEPAAALLFFSGDSMTLSSTDLQHLLQEDSRPAANFPLLAFQCHKCMVRPAERNLMHGPDFVVALAVPQ
jgi:hypothetical protein